MRYEKGEQRVQEKVNLLTLRDLPPNNYYLAIFCNVV